MSAPKRVRLAVVGVGEHSRRNILPALRECQRVTVQGLYDVDEKARLEAAEQWSVRAYGGLEELLGDDSIDVVYTAVPTGLHAEIGKCVLDAGRHFWCEKPLCATWADWSRLMEHGRTQGRVVFECLMFPYHSQFQRLRKHLESGTIGRIRSVTARFGFPHLPPGNFRYKKSMGGGALLDAATYPIGAARILLGDVEVIGAVIESEPGFEVDVAGTALLRSQSGVHAHIEWGFGRAYRNELEVWGEGGTIYADRVFSKPATLEASLRIRLQNGENREEVIPPCNHFAVMFDAFAEAIQDGRGELFMQETWAQGRLLDKIAAVAKR